ncbi:hypothetical protein E1551_17495 [Shigella sonnei]|nr:hypothetical protein [Shigella sonnei]
MATDILGCVIPHHPQGFIYSIYMNASRLQGIHCFDMTGRLQLYIRLYCSRNAASPYVIRRLTPYFHGGLQAQNTVQI